MTKWLREIPPALVRIGKTHKGLKYPIVLLLMIMKAACEACNGVKALAYPQTQRRVLAGTLSLCMVFTLMPIDILAAAPTQSMGALCEHHPAHTPECGYTEGTAGTPCTHEHTDDCYQTEENCVHSHTEDCYDDTDEENIIDTDAREHVNCTHVCSEETGCITKELYCLHEQDEHDDTCGYTADTEETPCDYICELCSQLDEQQECDCQTKDGSGVIHEEGCPLYVDEMPAGQPDTAQEAQELIDKLPAVDELDTIGTVQAVQELINKLPTVDQLDAMDTSSEDFPAYLATLRSDTASARSAYAALTDEDKEDVDIDVLGKLAALEEWLETYMPENYMLSQLDTAGAITIQAGKDNTESSGTTLQEAVKNSGLSAETIKKLTVTAGSVTEEDWEALRTTLPKLTDLTIAEGVDVADIPDNPSFVYTFPYTIVSVTIPQEIQIGKYAFQICYYLKDVDIPNAKSIGNYAFNGCKALTTVNFPNATYLGDSAFNSCKELTDVSFPEVTSTGKKTFSSCEKLKTVSFPKVKSIGTSVFESCKALETVSFPEAISIGETAFKSCEALKTVSFPKAESIGETAFGSCKALTDVSFPEATSIGEWAFSDCIELETVSFSKVTSIGKGAFTSSGNYGNSACTSLKKADFPNAESIGERAFYLCESLDTLLLGATPPSVSIASSVFRDCPPDRTLNFVAADGTGLSEDKLAAAQAEYNKYDDSSMPGEAANNSTWYGWKIGGTLPAKEPAPGGIIESLTQEKVDAVFGKGNAAVDADSGKITLNNDISVLGTIEIKCTPINIDLAGHKITGEPGVGTLALAENSKALTITGPGSIIAGSGSNAVSGKTGSLITVNGGAILSGGNANGTGDGGDGIHTGDLAGRMVYQTSRSARSTAGQVIISDGTIAGGSGSGTGSGGDGIEAAGDIEVKSGTVSGGTGGSGGANGGTGGSGLSCTGSVKVASGVTVSGGSGGAGTVTGGTGGNGITATAITIDGSVTGGAGGDGAAGSNGSGGSGGNGANQADGEIQGKGTIIGGNGGSSAGTGTVGSGGGGIGGGAKPATGVTVVQGRAIEFKITCDAGTTVTVPNEKDAVNAVLTPGDKENPNLTKVKATLTVKKQDSPEDKDKAEAVLSTIDAKNIGAFFDITLAKEITVGYMTISGSVEQTSEKIEITITIPADIQGGSKYQVIRVHDNKGEALETTQSGNNLTFKTDKFSTYAIAYTPKGSTIPDPTPTPGGSGGSFSDDSSSGSTVTPPSPSTQDKPATGETTVTAPVDQYGNASVTLSDKAVADAIKAAQDAVKKDNPQGGMLDVQIKVETDKAATQFTVTMPKTVQEAFINNKVNSVIITSNAVTMSFSKTAIEQINSQAKADITITAAKTDTAVLTGNARTAIGTRPVFNLTVGIVGGEKISSFGAGSVSVAIPYALGANENAGNIQAVYVDDKGNVEWLKNSVYDSVNKVLTFSTTHFSIYGVAYTFDQYEVMADVPKNQKYRTYTVQKGDSFWRIAKKFSCTMSELERLNNKSRFDIIYPGDVLRVPEM